MAVDTQQVMSANGRKYQQMINQQKVIREELLIAKRNVKKELKESEEQYYQGKDQH